MSKHSEHIAYIRKGQQSRINRFRTVIIALAIAAIALCCTMMIAGNTVYAPKTIIRVLSGHEVEGAVFTIKTLRWPRMLAGVFSGFAFGIAGSAFQTMFRNPLANPNIIGITSGSSAGAVFAILILKAGASIVFTASIVGAILTTVSIYVLSRLTKYSTGKLILIGIGFQTMLNAMINYMLILAEEQEVSNAQRWMTGSLNGVQMDFIIPLLIVVLTCTPALLANTKKLTILELGDEAAIAMGVNANGARITILFTSVVLVALATATTGPIAFVSFLAGPIAKRMAGNGNTSPLAGGMFGAVLVLLSDLAGQNVFQTRYPVGVITGILGAPYLIYLLIRMNRHGEL